MTWVVPAVACAVSYALSGAWQKAALADVHPRVIPFAIFAGGLPVFAVLVVMGGAPARLEPGFARVLAASIALNFLAYHLYARAIRISPLSLTVPFLAFTPLFMPVTSYLTLGAREVPGAQGLCGIALVVGGAYLLNAGRIRAGALAPIRAIANERGSLYMLGVALIWSVTSNLDKMGIERSSRDFWFLAVHVGYAAAFAVGLAPSGRKAFSDLGRAPLRLLALGLISAFTLVFQGTALLLARAPYVIATKRAGLLFSILIGCYYFREGRLTERLPGGALMAAGAALVLTAP